MYVLATVPTVLDVARQPSVLEDLPCDDQPLNFAGALANRAQLYIAVKLLGGIVLDKSIAAVNLHALVGAAHRNLAAVELRHRGLERGLHTGILHRGRAMSEQAGGIDFRRQIGELERDCLELADRLAELLTLLGVVQRGFIGALRHT